MRRDTGAPPVLRRKYSHREADRLVEIHFIHN